MSRTHTAALGLAIATVGCESKDPSDGSFELVSASLDATGQSVVLRFSEPVAPVDGVDPSAFRISWAAPTALCGGLGPCVDQTTYWDPNFYANYYISYEPGMNMNVRFEVDMIAAGNQANEVSLHFGAPLDPALCEYLAYYQDEYDYLYVHYSPGDIPLTNNDGEALAAIGPEWVEFMEAYPVMAFDGTFPNLDPKIAIPCSL
jgi:hypothetical protein